VLSLSGWRVYCSLRAVRMMRQYSVGVNAPRELVCTLILGNSGNFSSALTDTAMVNTFRTATKYWLTVVVEKLLLRYCVNDSSCA
jgi:hypothetical protein